MLNAKTIGDKLNALANIYGVREIGGIALITWIDALSQESEQDIISVLDSWPKFHDRMPLPVNILNECQRRRDDAYQQIKQEEMAEKGESMSVFVERTTKNDPARSAAIKRVLDNINARHTADSDPYTFWQAELLWRYAHNGLVAKCQYDILYELFGNPIPISKIEEGCRRYERVCNVPRLDFTEALRQERERMNLVNPGDYPPPRELREDEIPF